MNEKPVMNYETLCGHRDFADSNGRAWRIRVFTLGGIGRFFRLLSVILATDSVPLTLFFYSACLRNPEPGLHTRLRRLLGLSDFSRHFLLKNLPWRDIERLRDEIMLANLGTSFDEFVEKEAPRLKKKISLRRTTGCPPSSISGNAGA